MSTAALDARLVGGNRLLYACIAASLALHACLVLYAPKVKPREESAPRITATIRSEVPIPAPEPVRQAEPARAPVAKPDPPPKPVAAPPTEPAPQVAPQPRAERPRSADPSPATPITAPSPAPAAPPVAAVPVAVPAPAPSTPAETRSEARPERGAPLAQAAAPTQAPEVSERELVAQYQLQIAGIVETRRLKRYPSEAMQNGWEGASTVLLRIGTDGKVAGVETATSSGHDMLDEQARISISRAKPFVPIPDGLKGRAFEARVRVVFSLKGQ